MLEGGGGGGESGIIPAEDSASSLCPTGMISSLCRIMYNIACFPIGITGVLALVACYDEYELSYCTVVGHGNPVN